MRAALLAVAAVLALVGFGAGYLLGGGSGNDGSVPEATAAPGPKPFATEQRQPSIAAPGGASSLPALLKKRTPRTTTTHPPPTTTTQPPPTTTTQPPPPPTTHTNPPPTTTF
jgi:serine/threonine-protein kinase